MNKVPMVIATLLTPVLALQYANGQVGTQVPESRSSGVPPNSSLNSTMRRRLARR
jgi:hypothetical protein